MIWTETKLKNPLSLYLYFTLDTIPSYSPHDILREVSINASLPRVQY